MLQRLIYNLLYLPKAFVLLKYLNVEIYVIGYFLVFQCSLSYEGSQY